MAKTTTIKGTERVPINRTAAIVTTPAEKHYYQVPQEVLDRSLWWDAPPPMYNKPPKIFFANNLIGTRRGMITIIGYYGHGKSSKTSQWVGRCDCGRYLLRNGKTWRKGLKNNITDRCDVCDHLIYRGK